MNEDLVTEINLPMGDLKIDVSEDVCCCALVFSVPSNINVVQ